MTAISAIHLWQFDRTKSLLLATLLLSLSACASKPDHFGGSRQAVVEWSKQHHFSTVNLPAEPFSTLALARGSADVWMVYIEGDGAPWPSPFYPPADPTPRQPVSLALAAADNSSAVLYLGRPCQYLEPAARTSCSVDYWTEHRFSPEVIDSYQQQLDYLKKRYAVERFRLVGYSGGGVVATLLASRRTDVEHLITVASPLSLTAWTKQHGLSPLHGSLDPASETGQLPPAWHFVGNDDKVVPSKVVADFVAKRGGHLLPVAEFDHVCCWSRDWPSLLEKTR